MENSEVESQAGLVLSDLAMSYLAETGKWAKLISISGYVLGVLVILNGFVDPSEGHGLATIGYILVSFLYFIPARYLYKFSDHLKNAILTENVEEIEAALNHQRSFYKFIGVYIIIAIIIILLLFVAVIAKLS